MDEIKLKPCLGWAVFRKFDNGEWCIIPSTISRNKIDAIAAWNEKLAEDSPFEYQKIRRAGEAKCLRVSTSLAQDKAEAEPNVPVPPSVTPEQINAWKRQGFAECKALAVDAIDSSITSEKYGYYEECGADPNRLHAHRNTLSGMHRCRFKIEELCPSKETRS